MCLSRRGRTGQGHGLSEWQGSRQQCQGTRTRWPFVSHLKGLSVAKLTWTCVRLHFFLVTYKYPRDSTQHCSFLRIGNRSGIRIPVHLATSITDIICVSYGQVQ